MSTGPVAVCRTSDLAEAGAFWTQEVAERPLLVTRNQQGAIHAFENLCRHRGVRLVQEKHGVTKAFTCLLHGWTYAADGQMGGFPLMRLAKVNPMLATIRENNSLIPLSFEVRHGFVWVAPRPRDVVDVIDYLGGAIDEALATRNVASFTVSARDEEPLETDFHDAVRARLGTDDGIHILSDDTVLALHPRDLSVFTLIRRRADVAFFGDAASRALEHIRLTP